MFPFLSELSPQQQKQLLIYLKQNLTPSRKAKIQEVLKNRTKHFTVVLEDLSREHNAGAIARSCDAFGIQDLYLIGYSATPFKKIRGNAKGSHKWVDFHTYPSLHDSSEHCLKDLKKLGYQLVGTSPLPQYNTLDNFDISKKTAFLLGSEKYGLSPECQTFADTQIYLPMIGFAESLNVSVALAIILFQLTKRLQESVVPWQLAEEEKLKIELDWTIKSISSGDWMAKDWIQKNS